MFLNYSHLKQPPQHFILFPTFDHAFLSRNRRTPGAITGKI
jgi:hypothetical protein